MTDIAADLVLHGGRVHTVDDARPEAEAVAVRGGRIVAVGGHAEVRGWIGPTTEVLDLRGRTLLPGFQDAHVHPVTAGLDRLRCDLSSVSDIEGYLRLIAAYADRYPDRAAIIGAGWEMGAFPGGTPSRTLLDQVVPDRPVILENRDGHGSWVNTRTLELAGVDATTPDPSHGRIEREADGSPQGTLHESAMGLVGSLVPAPSDDEWLHSARIGQAELHRLGITAWHEAAGTTPIIGAYRRLAEAGELTGRVTVAQYWRRRRGLGQVDRLIERRASLAIGRLRADRVKLFLDGVLENFTGALLEPYLDATGRPTSNRGMATFETDELHDIVRVADAAGFHVHCHAIGDRAVRDGLDAIETAITTNPHWDRRHTIAHIQLVHPADVPRFAALGVVANGQPLWALHERQMDVLTVPFLGPERSGWQYPFGSLLRAGARLAFGSDWAVSTPDPLQQIEVAVRRVAMAQRDAPVFLPEERITLQEAVRAFTLGAAYVNGIDAETGSITVGKAADLVVLDRDLFAPEVMPGDARVALTLIEGQPVYEAPSVER